MSNQWNLFTFKCNFLLSWQTLKGQFQLGFTSLVLILHHCWKIIICFVCQVIAAPVLLFCIVHIDFLSSWSCLSPEFICFLADCKIVLDSGMHREDWNRHIVLIQAICPKRSREVSCGWAEQYPAYYAQPESCTQLQWVAQKWICDCKYWGKATILSAAIDQIKLTQQNRPNSCNFMLRWKDICGVKWNPAEGNTTKKE